MMNMNSNLLSCGTCQEPFTQLADLRHHSRKEHTATGTNKETVIPVLAREGFLSQSFSSLEEFYGRAGREEGGGDIKRKSLFDGIKFPIRKKKKVVGAERKMREKLQRSSQEATSLRKFLLMFDCKVCQTKFSKLGELRRHTESAHTELCEEQKQQQQQKVEEKAEVKPVKNDNEVPSLVGRGKVRADVGGSESHSKNCGKCRDFQLDQKFKFPFGPKFQARLLAEQEIDVSRLAGFTAVPRKTPAVKPRSVLRFEQEEFLVSELKGEGGFAKVFSATWSSGPQGAEDAVLKVQKPSNDWEWFVLQELHHRLDQLDHPVLGRGSDFHQAFMSSPRCFNFQDGSIIVSKFLKFGTVLDLVNVTLTGQKNNVEPLAITVLAEILAIVELLHSMDFIHGDLKPDNLMLTQIPGGEETSTLQLIDFGKVIDLRFIPANVVFDELVTTSGLKTVEMREKRPYR